jgi:hypothetical protein
MPWFHRDLPYLLAMRIPLRAVPPVPWQRAVFLASQTAQGYRQQQAKMNLLRGWLALESGDVALAEEHLRTAEQQALTAEKWVAEMEKLGPAIIPDEYRAAILPVATYQLAARAQATRCRELLEAARR